MIRPTWFAAAALLAVAAAGCAAAPAAPAPLPAAPPSAVVVAPRQEGAGGAIAAPRGPTVLTLSGLIGATNVGRTLRFDAVALERLGVVKVGVHEPWVRQDLEFEGLWLADLLAAARVGPEARGLHLTALDDYQIDLTTAEVEAGGVFLAAKRGDGSPIPIEEGGPTRIVFVGGVASGASPDRWIWSLTTIDVR